MLKNYSNKDIILFKIEYIKNYYTFEYPYLILLSPNSNNHKQIIKDIENKKLNSISDVKKRLNI